MAKKPRSEDVEADADGAEDPKSENAKEDTGLRGGSLGAFIRAQREMANLSLRQLSTMAEISNAYLSQIERDLHEPSLRVLKSVGSALGISPETLMSRAGLTLKDPDGGADAVDTEQAILADQKLSEEEKRALLSVYRSYLAARD